MASTQTDIRTALQRAIDHFGTEARLAKACGVTQSAISRAKVTAMVSADLAKSIHRETGVPASLLRPDLWRRPDHVPIERVRVNDGDQPTSKKRRRKRSNHRGTRARAS